MRSLPTLLSVALLPGCLSLDGFLFNPRHCSIVGPDTCEGTDSDWDAVCVPCDAPYDWARDYDWMPATLADDEDIRPIANDAVTRITIETDDGLAELDAYVVPAHGDDPDLAQITVVYNHGNYASIEHYLPRVRMLHEWGVNVLVWDYRGYGKSMPDATPTVDQFLADARQVRDLADALAVDPDRVVIYGNSLGAIPSVEMALHRPGCALMLEAGFTSVSAVAESNAKLSLGEQFLSGGQVDNVSKVAGYRGPLLAMIGDADEKFTVADTRALVDNAAGSAKALWVLPGVKHGISNGGVPEAGLADYRAHLDGFLAEHAPGCLGR